MKTLTIATRKSQLALIQANLVKDLLLARYPDLSIELLGLTTQGDQITDRPLAEIGGKGIFLKELQQALLAKQADIAVHSAKDVPVEDVPGLEYTVCCERADARDVLVTTDQQKFSKLPKGAVIGTCSYRRRAQLLAHRPDLQIKDLRGNVDTRLKKLAAGDYQGIVLAAAGLIRLQQQKKITEYFDINFMVPSVGQGALMIETRADDHDTKKLIKFLHQPDVALRVAAERAFTKALHGDCHSPIGVYAELEGNQLTLTGLVADKNGEKTIRLTKIGKADKAEQLGIELANTMLQLGAAKLLRGAKS